MLYIIKVLDGGEVYEYEYGSLPNAEEHYECEKSASMWMYKNGKEILIKRK